MIQKTIIDGKEKIGDNHFILRAYEQRFTVHDFSSFFFDHKDEELMIQDLP